MARGFASGEGSKGTAADTDAAEASSAAVASAADTVSPSEAAAAAAGGATSAAGPSGAAASDLGDYHTFLPKLVVFGGNGYVGSRVCQQGLQMGAAVVSVNRSGRPRNLRGDWLDQVEWVQVGGMVACGIVVQWRIDG